MQHQSFNGIVGSAAVDDIETDGFWSMGVAKEGRILERKNCLVRAGPVKQYGIREEQAWRVKIPGRWQRSGNRL